MREKNNPGIKYNIIHRLQLIKNSTPHSCHTCDDQESINTKPFGENSHKRYCTGLSTCYCFSDQRWSRCKTLQLIQNLVDVVWYDSAIRALQKPIFFVSNQRWKVKHRARWMRRSSSSNDQLHSLLILVKQSKLYILLTLFYGKKTKLTDPVLVIEAKWEMCSSEKQHTCTHPYQSLYSPSALPLF